MTVMMRSMQTVSKRTRVAAGPTPQFVELCKTLYGEHVDPEIIWTDVVKLSPDQADLNARRSAPKKRTTAENIALATNTAGVVAAPAAIYGAVRAARRNEGGIPRDVARAIGERRPKGRVARLVRTADKKIGRKGRLIAGGAAVAGPLLQAANAAGDAISAAHFAKPKSERDKVAKAVPSDLRPQVNGLRSLWRSPAGGSLQPTKPKPPKPLSPKKPGAPSSSGAPGGQKATNPLKPPKPLKPKAPVTKSDDEVVFAGEFSKFDDAKRQAFGWASVVKVNGQPVVDRQGDYIDLEDLENAAYQYVHKSRVGGDMHRRNGDQAHKVSDMIESMVFTDDKIEKMNLPADFPRGWWVGYQIHDEDTWQEVRKKGRTGFSIHGRGIRKEHTLDDVMGY